MIHNRLISLIAISLSLSCFLSAQNDHVDSMKQVIFAMEEDTSKAYQLGYLAYVMAYYDKDQSMDFARQGISLSKKLDYVSGEIFALMSLALTEQNQGINNEGFSDWRDRVCRTRGVAAAGDGRAFCAGLGT